MWRHVDRGRWRPSACVDVHKESKRSNDLPVQIDFFMKRLKKVIRNFVTGNIENKLARYPKNFRKRGLLGRALGSCVSMWTGGGDQKTDFCVCVINGLHPIICSNGNLV